MIQTLFLQSETADPYKLYESMLREHPVYWDASNRLWAVYSYKTCLSILNHQDAHIPVADPTNEQGLNDHALKITNRLARLSNGMQHEIARQTGSLLFEKMKTIAISEAMERILRQEEDQQRIDWVGSVCKKLPVLTGLKSFDFKEADSLFISGNMQELVKIMQPVKTPGQVAAINKLAKEIYTITEKQIQGSSFYQPLIKTLSGKYDIPLDEAASFCVSNMIGLFIQSYDAGRGVLSNSLLQILTHRTVHEEETSREWVQRSVIETLRFDPPVHSTRRIAMNDITVGGRTIKKGETILLVLAAANHDPQHFTDPGKYDIHRINNNDHLSFGSGGHACLAKHFSVNLATETLNWLLGRYKTINLPETQIQYEPVANVRLPKNMFISLSNKN